MRWMPCAAESAYGVKQFPTLVFAGCGAYLQLLPAKLGLQRAPLTKEAPQAGEDIRKIRPTHHCCQVRGCRDVGRRAALSRDGGHLPR